MSYRAELFANNPSFIAPAQVAERMAGFRGELGRLSVMVREVVEDGKAKDLNAAAIRDFQAIRDEAKKLAEAASGLEDVVGSVLG